MVGNLALEVGINKGNDFQNNRHAQHSFHTDSLWTSIALAFLSIFLHSFR